LTYEIETTVEHLRQCLGHLGRFEKIARGALGTRPDGPIDRDPTYELLNPRLAPKGCVPFQVKDVRGYVHAPSALYLLSHGEKES
jgi:hypothetical protein